MKSLIALLVTILTVYLIVHGVEYNRGIRYYASIYAAVLMLLTLGGILFAALPTYKK